VDGDGTVVTITGPAGPQSIEFPGSLEVGRPPGLPHGSEIDATFVVNIGPLPLVPGQRYEWQLEIDSEVRASEGFYVRAMPASPPGQPPQG
jgi:hypothetical protein